MTFMFYKEGDNFSLTKESEFAVPVYYEMKRSEKISIPTIEELKEKYYAGECFAGSCGFSGKDINNKVRIHGINNTNSVIVDDTKDNITFSYQCPECGREWVRTVPRSKFENKESIFNHASTPMLCPSCRCASPAVSIM